MSGPIDDYLDDLVRRMSRDNPRALRELVAEAEAHLRDDAESLVATGLPVELAEAKAVARFGPVGRLVEAEDARLSPPLVVVARQTAFTALFLGGVGAVAVGVSGLINLVIYLIGGATSVIDVAPGRVLSASDCARWMALDPSAPDCRTAAVHDWVGEVIDYRIAVGVLGLLALVVWRIARRHASAPGRTFGLMLPRTVSDTVALTLFSAAGVYTLGAGVDLGLIAHGRGSGQLFSAATVSLAAAAVFGSRLVAGIRNNYGEPDRSAATT